MADVKLSLKDISTIGVIVAEKAMEMYKKGGMWHRDGKYLSCVDIGKIANRILKPTGQQYDFNAVFKPRDKKQKP